MIASCPSQAAEKERQIRHQLNRSGLLLPHVRIAPLMVSPKVFGYRNRAQFKTDGRLLGYVSPGTRTIAPISACPVLDAPCRDLLSRLLGTLPNPAWVPPKGYDWQYIDIDSDTRLDSLIMNRRRLFRQGNTDQNRRMQAWLFDQLKKRVPSGPVLELFAGSGNFTQILATQAIHPVLAVEAAGAAMDALTEKQLPGVRTLRADIYKKRTWEGIWSALPDPCVLVMDPPRQGFGAIKHFLTRYPRIHTLIYFSCCLPSFCRDAAFITRAGFDLQRVQPIDLFPHTPHVELMTVFHARS